MNSKVALLQQVLAVARRQVMAFAEMDLDLLERLAQERADLSRRLDCLAELPAASAEGADVPTARLLHEIHDVDLQLKDGIDARIRDCTRRLQQLTWRVQDLAAPALAR